MREALRLAREGAAAGEVPVGAVLVMEGEIAGSGWNAPVARHDPTAHAEILAIREAAVRIGNYRLAGSTLYCTLEPCVMCAGALMLARIGRLVLGAWDPKAGACGSVWDVVRDRRATHRVEVIAGVREQECSQILLDFFAGHRL